MNVGIYPGTFNPPTNGHYHMIMRASKCCSKLIVAVAENPEKQKDVLHLDVRMSLLKYVTSSLNNVVILGFRGLIVDFAKNNQADFLVRGVRNASDFEQEIAMASMNREMTGIETIFLCSSPEYCHISSTLVRSIVKYGKAIDRLNKFVPEQIIPQILELYALPHDDGSQAVLPMSLT